MKDEIIIEKLDADAMASVAGGDVGTAEMSWLTDIIA